MSRGEPRPQDYEKSVLTSRPERCTSSCNPGMVFAVTNNNLLGKRLNPSKLLPTLMVAADSKDKTGTGN